MQRTINGNTLRGHSEMNIEEQIKKLQYQIKLIGETLDSREHPIAALIISMDWNDADLDRAHDIFEKFDAILEAEGKPNWAEFEKDFRDQFKIGYQTLKMIVIAFYRNFQWTQVCEVYAKAHECVEFHEITRPKNIQ